MTATRMVIDNAMFMRVSFYHPFRKGRPIEVVIAMQNGDAHTLVLKGMSECETELILRKLGDAETVVKGVSQDTTLTDFLIQQDVLRKMEDDG